VDVQHPSLQHQAPSSLSVRHWISSSTAENEREKKDRKKENQAYPSSFENLITPLLIDQSQEQVMTRYAVHRNRKRDIHVH
jgi:predicted RNA-binding protein with RPS1 domain